MTADEQAQTAKALAMMFHSFPASAIPDVDVQMEAYMLVIADFDFKDVMAAIRRIMEGGEGHESRSFAPSTAELCQEVRRRREIREALAKKESGLRLVKSAETF